MTKKDKIRLLQKENRQLMEENKCLKEDNCNKKMKQLTEELVKIYDLILEKYKKLNELQFMGLKTKWQYEFLIYKSKIKSILRL